MAVELDSATLLYFFGTLDGKSLASCAQVCRAWRNVAASEGLWHGLTLKLEPHAHLRRDDLLPHFSGSWRAYYAWRWPLLAPPVQRILVENDDEDAESEISSYPAPSLLPGSSSDGGSGGGGGGGGSSHAGSVTPPLPQQQQQQLAGASSEAVPPAAAEGVSGTLGTPGPQAAALITGGEAAGGQAAGGAGGVCHIITSPQAVVQQATWCPAGALLAFTEMEQRAHGELDSRVVVADGRTGRRVCTLQLGDPHPPFYYIWSACATRLLFLSNWDGDVVALRSVDLAPALLPPPPPQAAQQPAAAASQPGGGSGGGQQSSSGSRQQQGEETRDVEMLDAAADVATMSGADVAMPAADVAGREVREVLLCTARPLFLDCSPTSTRLLWHGSCQHFGLCDAATHTAEDGQEEDCFFRNASPCGLQAPQWVVDPTGADWLLLPVAHPQPVDGEAGVLVLASLADVSEAYEADGSRLSPSLLLSLSHRIAPFSSARDLFFAACPDASMVAWCDRGQLHLCFRTTGACHQIFPPPSPPPAPSPAGAGPAAWAQQAQQLGIGREGRDRRNQLMRGSVLAMQWSPDGRRLLFLVRMGGPGPMVSLSRRPLFRWVVWDAPAITPPPLAAPPPYQAQPQPQAQTDGGAVSGWLGSLTWCCSFNPTLEFLDRYLPFFDQYSRSLRLWDPSSSAFCLTSRGRPTVLEALSEQTYVSVQPVPRPSHHHLAHTHLSGGNSSGGAATTGDADINNSSSSTGAGVSTSTSAGTGAGGSGGAGEALLQLEAPPPRYLAPGCMASWSWQ